METYYESLQLQARELAGYITGAKDIFKSVECYLPSELTIELKKDFMSLAKREYDLSVRISEIQGKIRDQAIKDYERSTLEQ